MIALRMLLASVQAALAEVPQNSHAWTYTIRGFDGSDYLTRTLLPRVAGHRVVLHRIHRPDYDRHLHNHPWRTARFLVVSGGYVEQRLVGTPGCGEIVRRTLRCGDVNEFGARTLHRIESIEPNTWTLGLLGERVQDWGFLVGGEVMPHAAYFASKNYHANAPGIS